MQQRSKTSLLWKTIQQPVPLQVSLPVYARLIASTNVVGTCWLPAASLTSVMEWYVSAYGEYTWKLPWSHAELFVSGRSPHMLTQKPFDRMARVTIYVVNVLHAYELVDVVIALSPRGIVTSILPVETQLRSKFNQEIKGLYYSESIYQDVCESGDQALFKANYEKFQASRP